MALGLLAAPAMTMAQEAGMPTAPKPTTPLSMYAYQSTVGTFYDLSTLDDNNELPADNEGRFMFIQALPFGADLEKGAALQNLFIVANKKAFATENPDESEPQYSLVTIDPTLAVDAAERNQLAIPLMAEMGLTHFCGQDVSGFAIAAIGGILFSDATEPATGYALPGITCQNADCITEDAAKNFLRVRPLDWSANSPAAGLLAPTKGDKAPVLMAFAMDMVKMQVCLWVQFDYMVGDMNWVFQIRYYADGQSDFIIKSLGTAEQLATLDYRFTPVVLRDKDNHIAFQNASDKDEKFTNWNVIQSGNFGSWNGMALSKDAIPAEGQTISVFPPIDPTAFSLTESDLTVETNRLAGKVVLNPTATSTAASEVINSICVLISKTNPITSSNNPPFKTSAPLAVGDKLGSGDNEYTVAYTGKPTLESTPVDLSFAVNDLTHNTEYHVSVFLGYFNEDAESPYSYSKPLTAYAVKTKRDGVQALNATNVTNGKSTVSIEPMAGTSTLLVKSDKASAPTDLTGKLEVGSALGTDGADGTVIAILDGNAKTYELETDIAAGEGFYLHGYAIKNSESTPAYSAPISTTVYRPVESLPFTWGGFTENQVSPTSTDLPLLVPGWRHDETSTVQLAFSMKSTYIMGETSEYMYALTLYAKQDNRTSVITPAFISASKAVQATFHTYCSFQPGNSITIEYRENGGEWNKIEEFTEFPQPNSQGLRPISVIFSCTKNATIEMRYTANISAHYTLAITSLEIEEGHVPTCFPPTDLTIDTANVTDQQLALRWNDETNTTASYVVSYQEVGSTEAENWTLKAATEKTVKLTELKPNTAYRMQVQAICATDDSSAFNTVPVLFTTYAGLPYTESLGNVYDNLNDPSDYTSPTERGIRTYTISGGGLTEETSYNYTWHTSNSSSGQTSDKAVAMGVHEGLTAAAMLSPQIYTEEPTILKFSLNSFSLTQNEDYTFSLKEKGVAPTEEDCRLYVAVSDNGTFMPEDLVLELTGAELALKDSAFEFNVEKTGAVQIAFFFENPAEHWDYAFYLEAYNLSLTAVPPVAVEYTLSLTASPAEGGTLTGAGKHFEGSDVTITATPNEGYDFVAWMNGTTQLATTATYTFKMPSADAAYTAVFKAKPTDPEEEYELTLTASPANGGRVSGAGSYLVDEEVTISAEANKGYVFVAWMNDTDTLSKEATYTFKMPAEDLSLTARFAVETANEDAVKANFNVGTKNGEVYIRNLGGLMVKTVEIYTLTGNRLHRFTPNGREDLTLPVNAGQALLFVRIDTENGAAVYKVYLH